MSRIITVTSGKGGVGKTNISVNTALYLASQGYRTCLFDAEMGLANVDILVGHYHEFTLEDVLLNKKSIRDIIIKLPSGLDIIPGGSGVKMMADPEPDRMEFIIESLSELDEYDFFIVDTSAGISKNVISFCLSSPEIVLVITPEPTSITDAYALLKILSFNKIDSTVMLAINQCISMEVANKLYLKFKEVVRKNLNIDIYPLGTIPLDPHVSRAVKEQKPLVSAYPNSGAAKGIKNIARYLVSKGATEFNNYDLNDFWRKCLERLNGELVFTYNVLMELGSTSTSQIHGINISSFLQLIDIEGKVCTLTVRSNGNVGYLYFRDGELIAAEANGQKGEAAALNIINWNNSIIEISDRCQINKREIKRPLMQILMESARLKDEGSMAEEV